MSLSEQDVAILATKRLKLDGRGLLPLMSMVQNALSNMAREIANDPQRRFWLMTDRTTATADIERSGATYFVNLETLIEDPQIMLDYLNYGTIFYENTNTFT